MAAAPYLNIHRPMDQRLFPGIPPGKLLMVQGTRLLTQEEFQRLVSVPGTFMAYGEPKAPMPATGNIAVSEWTATGKWPDPLYVPIAQRHALEAVLRTDLSSLFPPVKDDTPLPRLPGLDPEGHEYRLLPFQADGVRRNRELGRGIIRLPTGKGKTAIALTCAADLFSKGLIDSVVISAPRIAARDVWPSELRKFLAEEPVIVGGSKEKRKYGWEAAVNAKWVIVRHESVRLPDGKRHLASLLGPRTYLILDEVHQFKTAGTDRWNSLIKLINDAGVEYRLLLTATVIYDKPADFFGQAEILGLHLWNSSVEFENRYFDVHEEYAAHKKDRFGRALRIRTVGALKNPDAAAELSKVIESVCFSRTNEQLGLYFPQGTNLDQVVHATTEEIALYDEIIRPVVEGTLAAEKDNPNGGQNVLGSMTLERLFSDDPILISRSDSATATRIRTTELDRRLARVSPGSKLRALLEYLGTVVLDAENKAMVFSSFIEPLERILEVINDTTGNMNLDSEERAITESLRGRVLLYTGQLTDKRGSEVIDRFLRDPSTRVLLSTDAGGQSLNLQSVLTHIIHYDDHLSLGRGDQRNGRAVERLGQTRPVHVRRFILDTTEQFMLDVQHRIAGDEIRFVDRRIADLLAFKKAQRDLVLNPPPKEVPSYV